MILPPLYKYLDVQGAKLTLGNGTFKHSKPSDFNDTEDLTIQSIFPEETEVALKKLENGFTDVILEHLHDPPTCSSPMKENLAVIQHVYRTNPKAAEIVKAELKKGDSEPIYDVARMRQLSDELIKEINNFMQDYRIFCVSIHKDSERMWSEYAEGHRGIAVRIEPNTSKDSKFKLFRPVEYRETRPPLFEKTLDFIASSLFGDQEARRLAMLDKIIYSKTLSWKHEGEYRLAIPLRKGEPQWNTDKYHPEEITELYLGANMTEVDKADIVAKAKVLNPSIATFQAIRDAGGAILFSKI